MVFRINISQVYQMVFLRTKSSKQASRFFRPPPPKKKTYHKNIAFVPNIFCFTEKSPGHFFPSNTNNPPRPRLAFGLLLGGDTSRLRSGFFWMVQTGGASLSPKKFPLKDPDVYMGGLRKWWYPTNGNLTVRPLKIGLPQKERIIFLSHHFSGAMLNFGGVYGLLHLRMHEWVIFSKKHQWVNCDELCYVVLVGINVPLPWILTNKNRVDGGGIPRMFHQPTFPHESMFMG